MKKALITGITGQDGSYLAELLLSKGYQVYGLVRRNSTNNMERIDHLQNKIFLIDGDLTDQASLNRIVKMVLPDEVYNLGAQSFVAVNEVAAAQKCFDHDIAPEYNTFAGRPYEMTHWYGDNSRLRELGWKPLFTLDEGMKKTIEWFTHEGHKNYRQ